MANNEIFDKINALSLEIIKLSRNTLTVNMRFLDMAMSMLEHIPVPETGAIFSDGKSRILYDPIYLLKKYRDEKNIITRYYLHIVFHCVFSHAFINTLVERNYWDLACDIAAENIINELDLPCVDVPVKSDQVKEIPSLKNGAGMITAEKLYRYFLDSNISDNEIYRLKKIFSADNHELWYQKGDDDNGDGSDQSNSSNKQKDKNNNGGKNNQSENNNNGEDNENENNSNNQNSSSRTEKGMSDAELRQTWKNISERMQVDLETFAKEQGDEAGSLMQNLSEVNREKYDYTEFLKKFAVLGEAMKINDDEFDYIFYTYGLKMYENMPLIEPLEYKDVKRIRDFVIAIDTSGSVSGSLVQKFIEKTYNILLQEESYFRKINIHIIQCDTEIQEDKLITSQKEFEEYIKNMTLRGFGGTDFRPVFGYVNKLIEEKAFTNLKGLIYFTDGYGEFPEQQPPYSTAFVFIDDDYNNYDVPVWAIKLILKRDEI